MDNFCTKHHELEEQRKLNFVKMQAVAKKDIEHCFGILQIKWDIIKQLNMQ